MCTAIGIDLGDFYFGRTLDVDRDYGGEVVLTPKNFDYKFRFSPNVSPKFDILGMAAIKNGYPLYFDAINKKGLCMAGLRFLEFYCEKHTDKHKHNVAPFELIPFILSTCASVSEAESLLKNTHLVREDFSSELPTSPLHWIIADKSGAITVEPTREGFFVHKNPVGVLTNSPDFKTQMFCLNNLISLSPKPPENRFCKGLPLKNYSYGMGALGLPGDLSSMSRFQRAVYYKHNLIKGADPIADFYYVLDTCLQPKGLTYTEQDRVEYTVYASCCNAQKGEYYYKKYGDLKLYKAGFEQSVSF